MLKVSDLRTDERGVSALIIASALVLLMGMAAVAIDVGAGFNERRGNQTAADVGVLAGALDFNSPEDIVDESVAFVRSNVSSTFTDEEYATIWADCADPDRPIDYFPLPTPTAWVTNGWVAQTELQCLSQSDSEVRLRVPNQFIDTSFARVIGVNQLQTSAFAEASVSLGVSGKGVLPFAMRGTQGAGEACLKTSSGGTAAPPCDGPIAGSFGTVISPAFGDEFFPTTPNCNKNQVLAQNIAVGVDHTIVPYTGSDFSGFPIAGQPPTGQAVPNSDANIDHCSITSGVAIAADGVPINAVHIDTGNVQTPMTNGLVSNATFIGGTYPSRLQNTDGSTRSYRSGNQTWELDNTPLYEFLRADASTTVSESYSINGTPYQACDKNSYEGTGLTALEKSELMVACLQAHETAFPDANEDPDDDSAAEIFTDDVGDAARFAWAPRVFHSELPDGNGYDAVHDFRMVYIAGVFFNCSAGSCDAVFYPDSEETGTVCVTPPGNCKQLGVDQLSGWALPPRSVSADVRATFPFGTPQVSFAPILLR